MEMETNSRCSPLMMRVIQRVVYFSFLSTDELKANGFHEAYSQFACYAPTRLSWNFLVAVRP